MEFYNFRIHKSIFLLSLSPAVWKQSSLPSTLSDYDINSILKSVNTNTVTGIRDYVILLCFTKLGLGCIEVAKLNLNDFSWKESFVTIKNTKTNVDRQLPITDKLGSAIFKYLKEARPKTQSKTLFVRFLHTKGQSMGRDQIRGVIRRSYSRAGINNKITRTHILRRTFASKVYNSGNSLKVTADILGHRSIDSTILYTRLDLKSLYKVSGKWPGGSYT